MKERFLLLKRREFIKGLFAMTCMMFEINLFYLEWEATPGVQFRSGKCCLMESNSVDNPLWKKKKAKNKEWHKDENVWRDKRNQMEGKEQKLGSTKCDLNADNGKLILTKPVCHVVSDSIHQCLTLLLDTAHFPEDRVSQAQGPGRIFGSQDNSTVLGIRRAQ